MKRILFVDDEPKILDGLRRMLRPMRHEWQMMFAAGGQEALAMLEQTPCDVVVSDMRMPRMDGAQLMDEVQRRHPDIVRIILSGHSDQEMIFRSIHATHQFLAKPCEVKRLKATIERMCTLRELLRNDGLRTLVAGLATIPSLPALFIKVQESVRSGSDSLKTLADIIAQDMGMTAKILQLVNSAYFGLRGSVSTVQQAVSFLGLDTIQSLILTVHVFSQASTRHIPAFHIDRLWSHSLGTATLAQAIAKTETRDPVEIEQAYTAGLLHDVGILVLATNLPRYEDVLSKASAKGTQVWRQEQQEFGATHAEVGAYLLGLWGLSDPIVEAAAYHHRPGDCIAQTFSPLTAVHVANVLRREQVMPQTGDVAGIDLAYLEKLNLTDRLSHWREVACAQGKEAA